MRTVLVPLDGSELAARALPFARALVRDRSSRLVLVRSVVVQPLLREDQVAESFAVDAARKELREVAAGLRASGVATEAHVVCASAADGILTAVDTVDADLVVMSTHGRGGLGRLVHGSVTDAVLRGSPVPVLVVPRNAPVADWSKASDPRLVVALDGSELAERALPAALDLARQVGTRLTLLQIVEPLYSRYGYAEPLAPYGLIEPDPAEAIELARGYLESIAQRVRAGGIAADTVVEYGPVGATLVEATDRLGALAVVMATHGRAGLGRVVLGSVAAGLLRESKVPLLLVHPMPTVGVTPAAELEVVGRS